jgi:hypothetical protein
MKKNSLLLLLLVPLLILSTSASAANYVTLKCNANCLFSSCDLTITVVEGSGTSVACGCYFGIATCRSGTAIISGTPTKLFSVDLPAISGLNTYLGGLTNATDFYNVRAVLSSFSSGMSIDDYETARDNYLQEIGYLSATNQQIIQDYVDSF